MARRGIKLAGTPSGGPVYVRMPRNVLGAADVADHDLSAGRVRGRFSRWSRKSELIEQAARYLVEAQHPMINAGAEVTRAGANADLLELAELLSIPVTQGYSVFGDFPVSASLVRGVLFAWAFRAVC